MAYHKSERCFRRYEPIIAKALDTYPEPVRFKSKTRSNVTDAARCQDAITHFRKNQWTTAYPVLATLEDRPLSVWTEKDYTVVGPSLTANEIQIVTPGMGEGMHGALRCKPQSKEHVVMLISLINDGVLNNQPIELPKEWQPVCEEATIGLLNIAVRVEELSIILF